MVKEGKTDPGDMVCDDAKVKEPTSEVVAAEDGNVREPTGEVGVSDDVKVEGSTGEVVVADDANVKGPKGKVGKGKRKKREQDVSNGENNVVSDDAKVKGQTGKVGKGKPKKRARDDSNGENNVASRRMPKRAAACSNFKEKAVSVSEKEHLLDTKREPTVENEIAAIGLTTGHDDPRPNRRLVDFIFHDGEGKAQPVELLEVTDLFISGVVLPLEPSGDIVKDKGVRCEGFGRIETWDISGYEDGAPTIWVSTELADYDCGKPAASFRKIYGLFYEKAYACIEVYKKLSRSSGGNPDITLDELLAALVRSMNGSKNFPPGASIKEFILSRGEFIYNQLIGLDATSSNKEQTFVDLPVLVALRDEFKKNTEFAPVIMPMATGGSLKIGDGETKKESNSSILAEEEDEDAKLARLLQEEEDWRFMNQRKGRRPAGSNKYYIKINEDEIATDYPLPAYYKPNNEETDEYIIFDSDMDVTDPDQLPRSMLHNWSLYNSDSRLVSLELLPMKPCDDIDVTIFGSGTVTDDDGSGFCLDADAQSSSASSEVQDVGGIPIYLSAIKEWMIEIGASMVFISVRTDMAWYRLGKPSKQYAPWYETVLKTARLAVGIITLLKEQSRVARLSFTEIVKRLAGFGKDHPAFISSNPAAVERYAVVHGQILLQQFAEFPDNTIRNCPFVTGLKDKMESRHHTKWLVKKKVVTRKGANLNPMAKMVPIAKRKLMPATTTRLINRIWGEFYSNYSPEESKDVAIAEVKEEDVQEEVQEEEDVEEDLEEEQEEKVVADKTEKTNQPSRPRKLHRSSEDIKWEGEPIQKTSSGSFYNQAVVNGVLVAVGGFVFVETAESEELPQIYLVEYMYEKSGGRKMVHGRLMLRGSQTVLGTAANEREVFLTNSCLDFDLGDVKETTVVETRQMQWGYQFRKAHALAEKADRENAEDRKSKGLPLEYYCKSSYRPHEGAFVRLQIDSLGLGNGTCHACKAKEAENEKRTLKVNSSKCGFAYEGIEYNVEDFFYVAPRYLAENEKGSETFKSGRNVGLKPYVICQFLEIVMPKASKKSDPESIKIKARRYFRPEDISLERAYRSDIREVYFSEQIQLLPISAIRGKCEVRRKHDLTSLDYPAIFEHIFFCEHLYDCDSGAIKQLPISVKLSSVVDDSVARKKKGKGKEDVDNECCKDKDSSKNQLATLDIFAGCGGLSEGLERAGVSQTKWAIEYEEPAGDAFNLNHPGASVFINNCNVILGAIMSACGDEDDCMSTPEATEEAKKLEEKEINKLPRPGDVDFINGGPPCQGFSGMNRFNKSAWSKVQCEMILAFLSFADYFRPKYFLLENVRNFVSFNKGQTFRLAIASLLEMGYQVRFGILDAGAFGVSQSRKRAFIWAASPEETLPDWPEPMHVFAGSELKITLGRNAQYAAVRSTAAGAPFRSITVRDTIGDLPAVGNGASLPTMEYKNEPVSWYQKMIRRDMVSLTDHISKEMNELNLIRCQKIPKRPGADWRDLPDEKVKLSTGQMADLVPWCLPNTAERHNQWKGLFGRLDWEGNFPTSITDPQPMGKVGMCFHPDQDRIVTVRECARSQGFPDTYKFSGNIQHRHRQIGNAVPPPLAFALGRKLKEAVEKNSSI